ncbi:MAG: HNH endonuclease, partial [Alphaproteobacteria bacterium]
DLTRALEKANEQGFSALTAYEKGLFCAFVGGEALCLMSDATMAILDEHITQGKLGEAEALVAEFAREGATLAEKNTLELGFSEDAAKAAGLFVANVAKNLQHARPAGKTASKKLTATEPKLSKLTGPIKASRVEKELHPRVRLINNQKPKNYEYAGKTYPLEKLPETLKQKYPHLKQKYPNSVPFTGTGHPDFSRYATKKVKIKMTGENHKDFSLADKAAEFSKRPEGYTWHHHHDGETMMLVPRDLHEAVKHTGGGAIVKGKTK